MGHLSPIGASLEAFKTKVQATYPDKKPGAIPNNAGQLYRFVHVMKPGDLVIYRSKVTRQIHLGRVAGEYVFSPRNVSAYPNIRAVAWLTSASPTAFSQGVLYEIGSAVSLFVVKNYADEFLALV